MKYFSHNTAVAVALLGTGLGVSCLLGPSAVFAQSFDAVVNCQELIRISGGFACENSGGQNTAIDITASDTIAVFATLPPNFTQGSNIYVSAATTLDSWGSYMLCAADGFASIIGCSQPLAAGTVYNEIEFSTGTSSNPGFTLGISNLGSSGISVGNWIGGLEHITKLCIDTDGFSCTGEGASSTDQTQEDWLGAMLLYLISMIFVVWLFRNRSL